MLIYHTSHGREVSAGDCGVGAPTDGNVCFYSQLLPGRGGWAHVTDVAENVIRRYEMNAPFLPEGVRMFSVPQEDVEGFEIHEYTYEELTGRDWRDLDVLLLDPKQYRETQEWSRVWTSRVGVVTLPTHTEEPGGRETATLRLTALFDSDQDYVIMERQRFGGKKWDLFLLAGRAPMWADFPNQWHAWATDNKIIDSAIQHLLQVAPGASEEIERAARQTAKTDRVYGWRRAAVAIGREISRDLGEIAAGSWTSVMSMPIRIAERVGTWQAPRPRPQYEDPTQSGRVLLVAPAAMEPGVRASTTSFRGDRSERGTTVRTKTAFVPGFEPRLAALSA